MLDWNKQYYLKLIQKIEDPEIKRNKQVGINEFIQ